MTVAQGTPSKFEYLLNALERATMRLMRTDHGYAGHRAKVLDYVAKLERENAALSAQVQNIADHLFIDRRGDGIWLVCVEKVYSSEDDARAACRKWKLRYAKETACPHAAPHRYCHTCVATPCPIGPVFTGTPPKK